MFIWSIDCGPKRRLKVRTWNMQRVVFQLSVTWRQGKLSDHNQLHSVKQPLASRSFCWLPLLLIRQYFVACVSSLSQFFYITIQLQYFPFLFFCLTPPMCLLVLSQMQGPTFNYIMDSKWRIQVKFHLIDVKTWFDCHMHLFLNLL